MEGDMVLRTHHLVLLGGLAGLAADNGPALAGDDQLTTISVTASGPAAGLMAGFRTSDMNAAFVTCALSGSTTNCSNSNTNSSTKNIGNILCLPSQYSKYQATAACQSLLGAPAGNCQANSSVGKCPSGMTPVMPFCNYRTSSNMSVMASWDWQVTLPAAPGGVSTVDCQDPGYASVSP
jgi:hypothetical protein